MSRHLSLYVFLGACSWVFFFAQLQCCLARAIGTKPSAVLLMSLTFYSLFEVHACISIICFHYPGYPVERSFFFRHFALVYIETKLLFVLSEFPARMMEGLNFDDLSFTMQLLE